MDKIYILKKQKLMFGPYSLKVVKERGLKKSDMIWYEGLPDWTPVTKVAGMVDFIKAEQQQHHHSKTLLERLFGFLK